MNNKIKIHDVVSEKLQDLMIPGFIAEVSPLEAEIMGVFVEDALSDSDALEAVYD